MRGGTFRRDGTSSVEAVKARDGRAMVSCMGHGGGCVCAVGYTEGIVWDIRYVLECVCRV